MSILGICIILTSKYKNKLHLWEPGVQSKTELRRLVVVEVAFIMTASVCHVCLVKHLCLYLVPFTPTYFCTIMY